MVVEYTVKKGQTPTSEQIEEVRAASERPIIFDDDCPESTPEMLTAFKHAAEARSRLRVQEV